MTSQARHDEQQRLTPDHVRTVRFPPARWGRRGYDEEPVRAFLADLHTEMVQLISERASLWQEVLRLRRRMLDQDDGHDAVVLGKDDAHSHAVRILSSAQRTADRYVADARAYSGRLTEEARTRRDEVMAQAEQHAGVLLEEAYLRTFGEVYRRHLRICTEDVLRTIS